MLFLLWQVKMSAVKKGLFLKNMVLTSGGSIAGHWFKQKHYAIQTWWWMKRKKRQVRHWKCQNTQASSQEYLIWIKSKLVLLVIMIEDTSQSKAFVFLWFCQESCAVLAVKYNFINSKPLRNCSWGWRETNTIIYNAWF